ncbi:MAG: hypothetical protein CUN55_00495 [Phototrophicales bacterium]|nr:MAG: hypothetical protein CUN55_00495 [Phototrophicales bacterium]
MPHSNATSVLLSPSIASRREGFSSALLNIDELPEGFPIEQWQEQQQRYDEYWKWFTGEAISGIKTSTRDGRVIFEFPLRINVVKNFARKHASFLFGEVPDTASSMVLPVVKPKQSLDGSKIDEEAKDRAKIIESVLNEVWEQSYGRSIQLEQGVLSQVLGGCVFKVRYVPQRIDLRIPIIVEPVLPDFFLPVWKNNDYFDLLEAFVIYRIPARTAEIEYGIEVEDHVQAGSVQYMEHWTKKHYSIWVAGQPLTTQIGNKTVVFDNLPNPFNFVPFTYIPHAREGSFYGTSIVPDIQGLVLEYNARMADEGDAIRENVHRRRYVRNVGSSVSVKTLDENTRAINLGSDIPTSKNPPDAFVEKGPDIPHGVSDYTKRLWNQILRDGNISPTAFGEDEGSQRSGLTLALRMFPSTAHARAERTFWTDGLNQIDRQIILMLLAKPEVLRKTGLQIDKNFLVNFDISQNWSPIIPRDRESMVSEMILRKQAHLVSPKTAMREFGDIEDFEAEQDMIIDWLERVSELTDNQPNADGQQDIADEPLVDNQVPVAKLETA